MDCLVYDHAGSMHRMGDDEQLFSTMVGYLHQESDRRLRDLGVARERGDLAAVQRAAHVLKGQISNFGAPRAWNAAAHVEEAARRGEADVLPAGIRELTEALDELLAALAGWAPGDHVRS